MFLSVPSVRSCSYYIISCKTGNGSLRIINIKLTHMNDRMPTFENINEASNVTYPMSEKE